MDIEKDNQFNTYSLAENDIEIHSDIKPNLREFSKNELKPIFEEADSLSKKVKNLDPNWEKGVRSGIYTKVTGENNRIMRGTTNPVESGKFDLSDCNNHEFFNTVEKLVKNCDNGPLKEFYMNVDSLGKVKLYNFIFG